MTRTTYCHCRCLFEGTLVLNLADGRGAYLKGALIQGRVAWWLFQGFMVILLVSAIAVVILKILNDRVHCVNGLC